MPSTSNPPVDPCIVFENVRRTFNIRKSRSAKEAFVSAFRRGPRTTQFNAVDDLSFEVYPGESIAVLGRNGSGKSTTLKLLSGVLRPSDGWIGTQGRVAGLLEVGAGFHPNLTGRENVYLNAAILGMSRQETDERFEEILEFSEIGEFIDTEVKRYSSGMYSRLGFSVAVHTELDVLLVDEILSVGDAPFRAKCNDKIVELQDQGKTMFIVSHNAAQVKKLCQRGIVLDKGKKIFDGAIGEAVALMSPKKAGVPKPAAQKPGIPKPAVQKPKAQKPAAQKPTVQGTGAQKPAVQKPAAQRPAAQQKPAGDQESAGDRGPAARQHTAEKSAAAATESAPKSTPTTVQQTAQSLRGPMQQAPVLQETVQQETVQQEPLQPTPTRAPVPGSLQHRLATQNHRDSEETPVREVSEPASKRARHGA